MPAPSSAPRSLSPDQEYDFIQEPPQDFYCAVTLDLLLDPHQTGCCGHHLSREVVERLKREGKPCPMCQDATFNTHPDLYLRRKVREQQVRCPFKEGGCEWVGDLGNREAHLRTCPKQPWRCQHCAFSGLREVAQGHTEVCERLPVQCPNSCNLGHVPRCQLSNHIERDCPLQEVLCPFSHVACTVRLPRSEMEVHVQHNEQRHILLTCSASLDLTRQLNERVSQKEAEIEALKAEVARMGEKLGERVQAVEASLTVQSEWMESNETLHVNPSAKASGDKETVQLMEEAIKKATVSEMQGLQERAVQGLRETEQENTSSELAGDSKKLTLQEMVEKQAQVMRDMEERLDDVVTKMEQNTLKEAKKQGAAMKEMAETVSKAGEERQKALVKGTEKVILQQMKTSQDNIEAVITREITKDAGKREDEVNTEVSALGKKVEVTVRGMEGVLGKVEQEVMAEFTDIKTQLKAIEEKVDSVEGLQRGMEEKVSDKIKEEVGKDRDVAVEDIKGEIAARTRDVRASVENQLTEMERKLENLSQTIHEKTSAASPRQHTHHRHKGGKQASSRATPPELHPKLDEPDSSERGPVPVVSSVQQPSKAVIEEDANQKPVKAVTKDVLRSLPLDRSPLKLPDSVHQVHQAPCDFKIEQFSKLKEQNKEWRSPPFYSPRGYKMCMGLWPNGFRSGAGTHVSVEFYKMRDVNTDKLRWNVKLPIHVRIYNYRTKKWEKEHVNGDTFTRSKVSGEFETSGYTQSHKLVAHDELDAYLLDDNFRIQIYKFEVKQ